MSEHNNELRVVIEQTEAGKVLNTVTLVYPEGTNSLINAMQLDLIEGMVKTARGWADVKAALVK